MHVLFKVIETVGKIPCLMNVLTMQFDAEEEVEQDEPVFEYDEDS